jgi:Tfp pilus assembly protein PilF
MASKRSSKAGRGTSHAVRIAPSPAVPGSAQTWRWLWLPGVLAIVALVYWPALRGPLVFDDVHLLFNNPGAEKAPAAYWIGNVRPALMATYWANFLLSGTRPFAYHATNLLLHTITAVIVFFLLRRLLQLAGVITNRQLMAVFGAGLFLLHPLQTESVAYIAGRSEEVAGLFYFAAWLVFVKHFGSPTKLLTAIEILLLAGVAVGGKESAISLPAILVLTDLYWNPARLTQQVRSRAKLYVPIVLGGLIVAGRILKSLTGAGAAGFSIGVTPARYALTECRVILTYVRLFLLPVGQNGDWGLPFYRSLTDNAAWVFVLGMVAFVSLIVWSYRRARLLSFGLAAFLVLLLPTSSIVPINDAIAERRVYVPIIGLIIASIWASLWAIDHFRPRLEILRDPGKLRIATALILVVAGVLSFERSKVWSSETLLWGDSVEKNPLNSKAHMGLGAAYVVHGQCADAVREFQTVERQAGTSEEITANLAAAYQCNRQPDLALNQLHTIVLKHPTAAMYDRIGYIEATMGHVPPALDAFEAALRLDPRDATAYSYRGTVRLALNDPAGAQADLRRALELDPGNETALKGLATLAARK